MLPEHGSKTTFHWSKIQTTPHTHQFTTSHQSRKRRSTASRLPRCSSSLAPAGVPSGNSAPQLWEPYVSQISHTGYHLSPLRHQARSSPRHKRLCSVPKRRRTRHLVLAHLPVLDSFAFAIPGRPRYGDHHRELVMDIRPESILEIEAPTRTSAHLTNESSKN